MNYVRMIDYQRIRFFITNDIWFHAKTAIQKVFLTNKLSTALGSLESSNLDIQHPIVKHSLLPNCLETLQSMPTSDGPCWPASGSLLIV